MYKEAIWRYFKATHVGMQNGAKVLQREQTCKQCIDLYFQNSDWQADVFRVITQNQPQQPDSQLHDFNNVKSASNAHSLL